MAVVMPMVSMFVSVVVMGMSMRMSCAVGVRVFVGVLVLVFQMHIELDAFNVSFLFAGNVKMITVKFEFGQLAFQLGKVDPEINHRAKEHVAADTAKNIEIKRFHFVLLLIIILFLLSIQDTIA